MYDAFFHFIKLLNTEDQILRLHGKQSLFISGLLFVFPALQPLVVPM